MTEAFFFQDLAVLMVAAGVMAAIFTRLGWPKVIGYIAVGILMSKHTWGGSLLADESTVSTIGQLGIVFLMLTLGLEFSAGDMKKIRHVTVPTALFDTTMMIWLGYTVGRRLLGWGSVPSLFLGAAICDSATTLLAKTIDEMKWSSRPFVRYIFGTTIFEDILCIGVIALVTGVASGKGMSFNAVGLSLGGLMVFLIGVVVFGLVLVPRLLNRIGRMRDDATLLLALLGNFLGTYLGGLAVRYAVPASGAAAEALCLAKLTQSAGHSLIRAVFCGILMYLAVSIYRDRNTVVGILFCIPVFILAGFEHSIADMFYFATSGIVSLKACGFIWTVILGNTIGGMLIPALGLIGREPDQQSQVASRKS